jgi:glyoxylase-like metal-dependent hydrolase (beta-lactamase superfamily II)
MNPKTDIGPGLFLVAGPDLTDPRDALAYLIEDRGDLALIDVGAGPSYPRLVQNIRAAGLDPTRLKLIVATHAHIDHVGALAAFARDYGPVVAAHEQDAWALETANPVFTAARAYGLRLEPVEVALKLQGRVNRLVLGGSELVCWHTPGHTPGSLSVVLDRQGKRYLFGQDIHGPFLPAFRSDLEQWRESMARLLELKADVLCEGHYGVFYGADEVARFIQSFLDQETR